MFATCKTAISIPGNKDGVTDDKCGVCANGQQTFYPCDSTAFCYCEGSAIPPEHVLPFTYCDKAVAVPNNANGVTDDTCGACSRAAYRYYPCDQPDVLCKCGDGAPGKNALQ